MAVLRHIGYPLSGPCSTRQRFRSHPVPPRSAPVLDQLRDQLTEPCFENARLLISELVANAVEHVREEGDIEVRVALADGALRVEVLDPGPGSCPPRAPPSSERGWGLLFTDRLASRWAADRDGARARVVRADA